MKTILIEYHGETVIAFIVGDYKATISQEDAKSANFPATPDFFAAPDIRIGLDQCKECGVWKSEDEELYGDGYCENCASMCNDCQIYFSNTELRMIDGTKVCKTCEEKWKTEKPKNYHYAKAIEDSGDYEAIIGDVKVEFEYIGEGISGDYTGEEYDVPLWRFYTQKKEYVDDFQQGIDHPDWNWADVEDGSYCTTLAIDTPVDVMSKLTVILAERMEEAVRDGRLRREGQECSHIDETWIKE